MIMDARRDNQPVDVRIISQNFGGETRGGDSDMAGRRGALNGFEHGSSINSAAERRLMLQKQ
jgi:hypothetical protein